MCALKLLKAQLSQVITEDEDAELFSLLTQQKALLEEDIKDKIAYFREQYS